jgi:hypothetical protein
MADNSDPLMVEPIKASHAKNVKRKAARQKKRDAYAKIQSAAQAAAEIDLDLDFKFLTVKDSWKVTNPKETWDMAQYDEEECKRIEEEDQRRQMEELHMDWPWVYSGAADKLLTQAPFAINQYTYKNAFKKAQAHQVSLGHANQMNILTNV